MDQDTTYIGNRSVWGGETAFGISRRDRRQHLYTVGKTGTGKSTLLRNLICQDIERGFGVGLIDPHGDLAEEILDCVPPWRADHVLYFNPADDEYPVGFNLVGSPWETEHYLDSSSLVSAFKHLWRDSWGPRLEYILYASVAALMECENVSLLGVPRMLVDTRFRVWVVKQVRDPVVRSFWENEFEHFDRRFLAETIAPIGKANLSKGRLGEDKSNLLGSLLVSKFQTAAMSRADMPEQERKDFYFYIDEFPNFSTESFAGILSEARKYRLNLTLSNQYIGQMERTIRDAVFGNVGSLVSFRVGLSDAVELANEFGGEYSAGHFTDLANYEVRMKLLENGTYHEPFLAKTLPPFEARYNNRAKLIKNSRVRFGTKKALVENRIRRWLG